jgi:hypothetical protein
MKDDRDSSRSGERDRFVVSDISAEITKHSLTRS